MKLSPTARFITLIFITLIMVIPVYIYGDAGPKPSVTIDIHGLEGQTYYTTLLSPDKHLGPYSIFDEEYPEEAWYHEGEDDYPIYKKFVDYTPPEGYYFLQFFRNTSQDHRLNWTYFPPNEYKVLIYLPQGERFIVSSEAYSNYAFATRYVATVEGDEIILTKGYKVVKEALSLIGRIILTILVEVGIARLFKIRQKELIRLIVVVNIVTQILLNVLLNFTSFYLGKLLAIVLLFLLEMVVFIIEATIYGFTFKRLSQGEIKGGKGILYALAANSASLLVGIILAFILPGMF